MDAAGARSTESRDVIGATHSSEAITVRFIEVEVSERRGGEQNETQHQERMMAKRAKAKTVEVLMPAM
jgi:hypothetical protein